MTGLTAHDPRCILGNAEPEDLAAGLRWIEGSVWMGDADGLLFRDLPRNRTGRRSGTTGVLVSGVLGLLPALARPQRPDPRPAGPPLAPLSAWADPDGHRLLLHTP